MLSIILYATMPRSCTVFDMLYAFVLLAYLTCTSFEKRQSQDQTMSVTFRLLFITKSH